jgi:hypothetical protein
MLLKQIFLFKKDKDIIDEFLNSFGNDIFPYKIDFFLADDEYPIEEISNYLNYNYFKYSGAIFKDIFNELRITISSFDKDFARISVSINVLRYDKSIISSFFKKLILKYSSLFIIGYEFDEEFEMKESETDLSNYEFLFGNIPKNKLIVDQSDPTNIYIDVSNNFGRTEYFSGLILMAAWTVYLNKDLANRMGISKMINENFFYKVILLPGDVYEIILYQDAFKSEISENYLKLKTFREMLLANFHS